MQTNELFEDIIEYPNPEAQERFSALVGLDDVKETLTKEASLLLNPDLIKKWSKKFYKKEIELLKVFNDRFPFFIFAGDVGTGKTTLAESFGDVIARNEKMTIYLYRLSLKSRGAGAVGEMTRLISEAFEKVKEQAQKGFKENKKPSSATVLLIDEADAFAQSREISQMHHEDRAGVNSLIRGIDTLANSNLPAIVLMCTNRFDAIDPAVKRRAAEIFEFRRPDDKQRKYVLEDSLSDIGFNAEQIDEIVKLTGPNKSEKREYGYTYSDLIKRFLPKTIIGAYPDKDIQFEDTIKIINLTPPTKPFQGEN
jgi:AAA+ superfamily predicted ATPase